jgi:hypothetical protein
MATLEEFQAALAVLNPEDFTKSGEPKVDPLNASLGATGVNPIDGGARDALWEQHVAAQDEDVEGEFEIEDPDDEMPERTVTITEASSDPVRLNVHGVGRWKIRLNTPTALPEAAIEALQHGNCTIEIA